MEKSSIKQQYKYYHDRIWDKRYASPYPLRRFVHQEEYKLAASEVTGNFVLDVGTGEGVIPYLCRRHNRKIVGVDISKENIKAARDIQNKGQLRPKTKFIVADAEKLPFDDNSFDTVICLHVLEHLPSFEVGLSELKRVAKRRLIIAVPTCLNLCAVSILGGDSFWSISIFSPFLFIRGIFRIIYGIFSKGVMEKYGGHNKLPHLWRYPWVFQRELEDANLKIVKFYASSIALPYFNFLIPIWKAFCRFRGLPGINYLGYGSIAVVKKL